MICKCTVVDQDKSVRHVSIITEYGATVQQLTRQVGAKLQETTKWNYICYTKETQHGPHARKSGNSRILCKNSVYVVMYREPAKSTGPDCGDQGTPLFEPHMSSCEKKVGTAQYAYLADDFLVQGLDTKAAETEQLNHGAFGVQQPKMAQQLVLLSITANQIQLVVSLFQFHLLCLTVVKAGAQVANVPILNRLTVAISGQQLTLATELDDVVIDPAGEMFAKQASIIAWLVNMLNAGQSINARYTAYGQFCLRRLYCNETHRFGPPPQIKEVAVCCTGKNHIDDADSRNMIRALDAATSDELRHAYDSLLRGSVARRELPFLLLLLKCHLICCMRGSCDVTAYRELVRQLATRFWHEDCAVNNDVISLSVQLNAFLQLLGTIDYGAAYENWLRTLSDIEKPSVGAIALKFIGGPANGERITEMQPFIFLVNQLRHAKKPELLYALYSNQNAVELQCPGVVLTDYVLSPHLDELSGNRLVLTYKLAAPAVGGIRLSVFAPYFDKVALNDCLLVQAENLVMQYGEVHGMRPTEQGIENLVLEQLMHREVQLVPLEIDDGVYSFFTDTPAGLEQGTLTPIATSLFVQRHRPFANAIHLACYQRHAECSIPGRMFSSSVLQGHVSDKQLLQQVMELLRADPAMCGNYIALMARYHPGGPHCTWLLSQTGATSDVSRLNSACHENTLFVAGVCQRCRYTTHCDPIRQPGYTYEMCYYITQMLVSDAMYRVGIRPLAVQDDRAASLARFEAERKRLEHRQHEVRTSAEGRRAAFIEGYRAYARVSNGILTRFTRLLALGDELTQSVGVIKCLYGHHSRMTEEQGCAHLRDGVAGPPTLKLLHRAGVGGQVLSQVSVHQAVYLEQAMQNTLRTGYFDGDLSVARALGLDLAVLCSGNSNLDYYRAFEQMQYLGATDVVVDVFYHHLAVRATGRGLDAGLFRGNWGRYFVHCVVFWYGWTFTDDGIKINSITLNYDIISYCMRENAISEICLNQLHLRSQLQLIGRLGVRNTIEKLYLHLHYDEGEVWQVFSEFGYARDMVVLLD